MAENKGSLPPTKVDTAEERLSELTDKEYRARNKIELEQITVYNSSPIGIDLYNNDANGDMVRIFPDGLEIYDGDCSELKDCYLIVQNRKLMVSYEWDTEE